MRQSVTQSKYSPFLFIAHEVLRVFLHGVSQNPYGIQRHLLLAVINLTTHC